MPYKDPNKQREAARQGMRKFRLKQDVAQNDGKLLIEAEFPTRERAVGLAALPKVAVKPPVIPDAPPVAELRTADDCRRQIEYASQLILQYPRMVPVANALVKAAEAAMRIIAVAELEERMNTIETRMNGNIAEPVDAEGTA